MKKNKKIISFVLIAFMMMNLITFNVFASGKKEILSSIDVCVQAGADADKPPTQIGNYQAETLRVKYTGTPLNTYTRKVLLMFDISSLNANEIAEGDKVEINLQLAELANKELNPNKNFTSCDVYQIPSTWKEDTITWNSIPQEGRTKVTSLYKRNITNSITSIDVTNVVKNAVDKGESKISFEFDIPVADDNNMIVFHSSRTTKTDVLKPTLTLNKAADIEANVAANKLIYQNLRTKWYNRLTGNDVKNPEDTEYKAAMDTIAKNTQTLWDSMNKGTDRTALWDDLNSTTISAHITNLFKNLETMSLAYASSGSRLYKNQDLKKDILSGLDWMYLNRYNDTVVLYNNWWDWDIGATQPLCNILILMYEDLNAEQLNNQIKTLERFNPNPYYVPRQDPKLTGANLLDTALVSALKGLIAEFSYGLEEARDAISDVLPYVTKGDGFYKDGSFIQHKNLPYTGGYGSVLMGALDKLLFILDKTQWEVKDPNIVNVYDWITNAFEPLYYNGAIMDMVSGRGVSRYNSNDHTKGRATLRAILMLSDAAPTEELGNQIKSYVKENIIKNQVYKDNYYEGMDMPNMLAVKNLLADDTIQPRGPLSLHKVYSAMDRVVHHRPEFSLGISMYSSRIGNFESINWEHKKGYHTGDGMLFLYNDDYKQFSQDYWPTIDSMRLPGITTDGTNGYNNSAYTNTKTWVGGSSINDLYGATGMDFEMQTSPVKAKKSWFSFDDEIVCLGAGITSTDGKLVETIVENRKIKDTNDNTLIINGETKASVTGAKENIEQAKWAVLSGNTDAGTDSIGYYFPEGATVTALRDTRTGSWREINNTGPTDPITKNYMSLAIEHGVSPTNETYSYVLLPNKTQSDMEQYNQNPDITVLANNTDVQAVKENKLGVVGINFWKPSSIAGVTSNAEASVMLKLDDDTIEIAVADPTQKNTTIELEVSIPVTGVVSNDTTITAETGKTIKLSINVAGSAGQSHKIVLTRDKTTKLEIVDLEKLEMITVDSGTDFANIPLPKKLFATTNEMNTYKVDVNWEKGNYDENTNGIYEISGTIIPPVDIENPKNIKATIKIIVGNIEIVSITNPKQITVNKGVAFSDIPLPTKVSVLANDTKTYDVDVKWNKGNYNENVVGKYEIMGTLQLSDNLYNPNKLFATTIVQIGNTSTIATDDTYVQGGADADKAGGVGYNPVQSKTVIATRTNNANSSNFTRKSLIKFDISAVPADIDKAFIELQLEKFETDFTECEVYRIKPDWTSQTATFNNVEKLESILVTSFTKEDIQNSKLKLDVTEAVKAAINEKETSISFKLSIPSVANNNYITFYSLESTQAKPTLSWTKDIISGNVEITKINNPSSQIVLQGTTIDKISLPKNVLVELANNEIAEVPVTWSSDNYNGDILGTYTLIGNLNLPTGILNTNAHIVSIDIVVATENLVNLTQVTLDAKKILDSPNSTTIELVKAINDLANAIAKSATQQ